MTHGGRRHGITLTAAALAAAVAVGTAASGSALAAPSDKAPSVPPAGDSHNQLPDIDTREKAAQPSAAQKSAAQAGLTQKSAAKDAKAAGNGITWNRFGSIGTVVPTGTAALATGLGSDPTAAARAYLERNAEAFGITKADIDAMEHVSTNKVGKADVVMLRQVIGGVPAGIDGLVVVAVEKGSARYVSSTLAPLKGASAARRAAPAVNAEQALTKAASNVGATAKSVKQSTPAPTQRGKSSPWQTFTADGLLGDQQVMQVAVPIPGGAARTAYHVVLRDDTDSGYSVYVDAANGTVIARDSLVDFDTDNPRWKVFTGTPNTDNSSTDTRVVWCWTSAEGCAETVQNSASARAWDVDPVTQESTTTTNGNNAYSGERWRGFGAVNPVPLTPDRNYVYPWTNQWQVNKCDPANYTSPEKNDINAATANLFASHNRMHDWSYKLGFTETAWNFQRDNGTRGGLGNDHVLGYSQSGAQSGSRNNANFGTPPEGTSGYSNMYLWQPLAGAFYAPCVDGDYDMSVIGHEYGHGISNRMAGGPNSGLSGLQAGAMGESWSDLMATEYLQEYGYVPVSPTATPMGAYVTGNPARGIRNYNFSMSPLNYSNVGYDLTGPQVHADGEIWSATHSDIRSAFMDKYGSGDAAVQRSCATGATSVNSCPGNRRWMQLVFDAWLLMPSGSVSMVDARNAMLAADLLRFGGANQNILWNGFAGRGLGQGAASTSSSDSDPTPSFSSAYGKTATLRFSPTDEDGRPVTGAKLFVGEYTARSVAIADTDDATALGDSFEMMPGARTYTVTAPGRAQTTLSFTARANQTRDLPARLLENVASSQAGATITGEGVNVPGLIDGNEGTTTRTVMTPTAAQKQFTIDLAGGRQVIRRVQVSALPDPGTAARFQNLRQFQVLACDARGRVLCTQDADYRVIFTSAADAFPGAAPRPVAPELKMRSFDIPQTGATHLRFVMVKNQCQGGPEFAGEQDNDPNNATDCATAYADGQMIAASEVQVTRR